MTTDAAAFDGTELDFWLGDWAAHWGDGAHGTNRLRRVLADRVIEEDFEGHGKGGSLHGRSWSVFDPERRLWRQTWVDDQGGYIDLVGERVDGWFAFARAAPEIGEAGRQRMVFRDVETDGFRWTWEASLDGGETWETRWEIAYRRAASTA